MPTAQDYDAVPYEDCPLIQTNPDYLSVIARLFGVAAPLPDQCRVLELGCASGGNIIPLAYYWPESQFLGVELSEKQAALGKVLIEELQLKNINILQADILTLDESLGQFDYIIVHGVYSWVPEVVQDHIIDLVKKTLAPNGVAFISYNTYPGWHFRMAVREMMLHHGRNTDSPEQKRDKGIELLRMLSSGLPDSNSISEKWIKREAETLLTLSPSYLLHDYLEENNRPVYFHQFMNKADASNLQYLAEADLYTMLGSTLTKQAEMELEKIDDLIEYEQYMDFYYLRYFRQTLLCHEAIDIERDLDIEKFEGFYFFAMLTSADEIDLDSDSVQVFKHPNGTSFDVSHPLSKAALIELSCHYPNACSYPELLQRARNVLQQNNSTYANSDADEMLRELFNLFVSQGLKVSTLNRKFLDQVTDKPRASRLARIYAKHTRCCVGSVHHGNVTLTDLDRELVMLLDGSRTKQQLAELLLDKIAGDENFRKQVVLRGMDHADSLQQLLARIDQSVHFFAVNGLLENDYI